MTQWNILCGRYSGLEKKAVHRLKACLEEHLDLTVPVVIREAAQCPALPEGRTIFVGIGDENPYAPHAGEGRPEEAIYHTNYENGDFLPNTDNVINPSLLIEGNRFKELMEYAGKNYQYTFVDVPPLGLVSDGEQIARMCDGAILCVRGGDTSKTMIKNSINQLERTGCPLLGVVMNRVNANTGGYYHKYYNNKYYNDKYYTQK